MIRDLTGRTSYTNIDSANEIRTAFNLGLRAMVLDMPFTALDTVVITQNKFSYALNSNFKLPVDGRKSGYRLLRMDKNHNYLYGLREVDMSELNMPPLVATHPLTVFAAQAGVLWFPSDIPIGDSVFIWGQGRATPVTGSGTLLTGMPEDDLPAAVLWAAALIANARSDGAKAGALASQYVHYVIARTGAPPVTGGPLAGGGQ